MICRICVGKGDLVPRAGFEPATTRSSAGRSPRLSYLGFQVSKIAKIVFKFSESCLRLPEIFEDVAHFYRVYV